jgi:amidophosphoribosyltransferase
MVNKTMTIQNMSGIAGVFHVPAAASQIYFALHAIAHRGTDAAGIAVSDNESIRCLKENGMLSEAIDQKELAEMAGVSAIGQVRMRVSDDEQMSNLQPIMVRAHQGHFAIVSSGMVLNADDLRAKLEDEGLIFQGSSDAELIAHLIQHNKGHLFEKISQACKAMQGAYTFLVMTKNTMYAYRSQDGIHPLYMARLNDGYVFSSETSSFNLLGASDARSLKPGELIRLGKEGFDSFFESEHVPHICSMEYVYYSKPDSVQEGKNVHAFRRLCGQKLAENEKQEADIVIGVPDTANSAAAGFAAKIGLPFEIGLIKNRYIGSTFVQPSKEQRKEGLRVRLNAISAVCKDKRIFLIDDSLCRGMTAKRLCQLLKEAGAKEVHLRIASPKQAFACQNGYFDTPASALAASLYNEEEMCALYGLDSIRFMDEEDFRALLPDQACMACFCGQQPICLEKEKTGE